MEIANGSLFPFPCLSLSALSRRRCRAPPARRAGTPPAKSNFVSASRGAPTSSWTHLPTRWSLRCLATPPRRAQRSPPRHRRGPCSAALRAPNSRVPQYLENPSTLFYALFHLLPAPEAQNTTASAITARARSSPRIATLRPSVLKSAALSPPSSSTEAPQPNLPLYASSERRLH